MSETDDTTGETDDRDIEEKINALAEDLDLREKDPEGSEQSDSVPAFILISAHGPQYMSYVE